MSCIEILDIDTEKKILLDELTAKEAAAINGGSMALPPDGGAPPPPPPGSTSSDISISFTDVIGDTLQLP